MKRVVPFADLRGEDLPEVGDTLQWQKRIWKVLVVDEKRQLVQLED